MNEITFTIMEHLGVLNEHHGSGWKKEVNVVAWNGNEPKIDIRDWDSSHEKMTRGITLTDKEAAALFYSLKKYFYLKGGDEVEER